MLKRKKHQQWDWTSKTDSAVGRYIKWSSKPHIQERIYKEHIEIPLRNTSRRVIKNQIYFNKGEKLIQYDPYKESSYEQEIENLVDECVSFFFTTLIPYINNGKIENIFGYVYSSIKHNLLQMNIERSSGTFDWKPLYGYDEDDSVLHRGGVELPKIEGSDVSIDEVDYINLMLNYWDKNIPIIWGRSNQDLQRKVASNIVELMRRSQKIKHFKVDSMRRYLRKMMDWNKGEHVYNKKGSKSGGSRNAFNRVIHFMRDRNKLLKSQYNKKGMIDFYYI